MQQNRLESLLESAVSTTLGFGTSFLVWQFVAAPIFGYTVTIATNMGLTSIFTVASLLRQYITRRWFNAGIHRRIHAFVIRRFS